MKWFPLGGAPTDKTPLDSLTTKVQNVGYCVYRTVRYDHHQHSMESRSESFASCASLATNSNGSILFHHHQKLSLSLFCSLLILLSHIIRFISNDGYACVGNEDRCCHSVVVVVLVAPDRGQSVCIIIQDSIREMDKKGEKK